VGRLARLLLATRVHTTMGRNSMDEVYDFAMSALRASPKVATADLINIHASNTLRVASLTCALSTISSILYFFALFFLSSLNKLNLLIR
jgi:hypothetical protein